MPKTTTLSPPARDQTLAAIPRGEGAEIRLTRTTYRGRVGCDVRIWWRTSAGDWAPSRKGVMIPADHIDAAIDALQRARSLAPERGR